MRKFLVMFAITFLASWQTMLAANGHFITDAAYRTKVETAFFSADRREEQASSERTKNCVPFG